MSRIKKFGTPLKFKGRLPKGDFKDLQYQMKNYASTVSQLLAENNFSMVAAHTHHMLTQVEAMERFHCALLPMSRHILESIGFASLNALKYEDQSQKRTNRLCRWMIQFQISGLPLHLARGCVGPEASPNGCGHRRERCTLYPRSTGLRSNSQKHNADGVASGP